MLAGVHEAARGQGCSNFFSRLFAVLAALSTSACATPNTATQEDEAAIRRSVLAMTEAFNARDDAALMTIATPDADFVTVLGRWTEGTSAYVAARRSRFDGPLKNAKLRPLETHVRFIRPDVAVVHVTHEISGMSNAAGTTIPPHPELSTRVYAKNGGRWVMTAFHNTGLPPNPGPR